MRRPKETANRASSTAPPETRWSHCTGIAARVGPEQAGAILRGSQVAMAFDALGDRWSAMVLREVFLGVNRFDDLIAATGASRATLTGRLRSLVNEGILHRHPYSSGPVRYEYRLTRMGADLYPTALMYWLWEKRYGGRAAAPVGLVHRACGKPTMPLLRCRHCAGTIDIGNVRGELIADGETRQARNGRQYCLHVGSGGSSWREVDARQVHVIDVIGDRWTALVQAANYFGLHRYADIQTALSIPSNTLADRLRLLVRAGVFSRTAYQQRPKRYAYRLTEKGRALYLPAFTLHQWANKWLLRDRTATLRLVHRSCGHVAEGEVVCDQCQGELRLSDVALRRGRE